MKQYFGIDVGGTAVKWAIVDDEYTFYDRGEIPTDFSSSDEAVEALKRLVEPYRDRVAGIGISAPGGFEEGDPDGTIHRGGALTYMDGCPLGKLLRDHFGLPVYVNNDGKLAALGEFAAGALKGTRVGVAIVIGTGIGGGIVVGGRVIQGIHGFAGEFSFLNNNTNEIFDFDNMFAQTAGWHAVVDLICAEKGVSNEGIDGRKAFAWVAEGDEAAQRGLDRYAVAFDNWLINFQAILDPDCFAIGGGISCHPELFDAFNTQMDTALRGLDKMGFPRPVVRQAELGNDANIYGAVWGVKQLIEG